VVGTLVGLLVYTLVTDPSQQLAKDEEGGEAAGGWSWVTLRSVVAETKECMRIPTFWVIVGLGRIVAFVLPLIHFLPCKFTNIFGASIFEATMRPNLR
jgi:hypothetical protein